MTIGINSPRGPLYSITTTILFLVGSACFSYAFAAELENVLPEDSSRPFAETQQLNNQQILDAFADVRDDAEVQDAAGSRAVNYWYASGRFVSAWRNGTSSGEVSGTWQVKNDQRCIVITAGLPERVGKESCNPVFRRGSQYFSFNSDGTVHGIHTLSALQQPSE